MGSRVQKIAGVIFALMFVAIFAVLNTTVLTLGTGANNQLSSTLTSSDTALSIYDQGTVSGSSVISAAKTPNKISSSDLTVYVATAASKSAVAYTKNSPYSASGNDENTINSTANFNSYLVSNDNSVVTGILFIQDSAGSGVDTRVVSGDIQGYDE